MIDNDTAGMLRILGLAGLAGCVVMGTLLRKWGRKSLISWLALTAAGVFLLLYVLGVLADADPAGHRLLPLGKGW